MSSPLRVLHLEDSPDDVELVQRALAKDGIACAFEVVSTRTGFEAALKSPALDLILSDYRLSAIDGIDALRIAAERAPQVPFILVSGTIGEEAAIEMMRGGATDYVLMDRLSRLAPAVKRALEEARERCARKKSEQALRASEEHYRLLFLNNPHPMWVFDRSTLGILAVNQAAIELYGYTVAEFLRMTVKDIRPAEEVDAFLDELSKPRSDLTATTESRHKRKDGSVMSVEVASHTLPFAGRDAVLVLVHDVTARKELEAQFRQSQKMEAVGRLAGGVAHDFNNLLTVILGHTEMLAMRPGLDPILAEGLAEIEQAGTRASQLTRQLLAFGRQQVLQPEVMDLNGVLLQMERMLRRMIGEGIDLLTSPGRGLGRVMADPGQLEQVLMNLVVNARDAMPEGGKLTIETANASLDESSLRGREGLRPGAYVLLTVTDSGAGMDAYTQARMFEPFFTTKEIGLGTGLGLSTVHGIVKQSGGCIDVCSEVGRGTTVRIYLPEVEAALDVPSLKAVAAPVGGSETILVIEEDDLVRKTVTQALRLYGYNVLEAGNRTDAVEVCDRQDGGKPRIALILAGVAMPGMGIAEWAARLRSRHADLPILCMSGYADRTMSHPGVRSAKSAFIQKPFSVHGLLERVREMLGEEHAAAA